MTVLNSAVRLWRLPSIIVLVGALGLAAWHPGARGNVGAGLEGWLLDLRFAVRGPLQTPETVAIVAFDDRALAEIDSFPPARSDIAKAVSQIFAAGARAVVLDMLLVETRADDAVLADALGLGPAVLGVAEAPAGTAPPQLHETGGFAVLGGFRHDDPLPALAPVPSLQPQAMLGHVTVRHDPDGALRRMRPARALRTVDDVVVVPGLGIAAASVGVRRPELVMSGNGAQGRLEGPWPAVSLDLQGMLPLNYYGPAGAITTSSAAALDGADLRGRVVFLGATATGFGDRHSTAFDATLPGVEAHATLAANLADGRVLRRDSVAFGGSTALAIFSAFLGLGSSGLGNPRSAFLAGLVTTAVVLMALQGAFSVGWWIDATTVLAALALGLAIGATVRLLDHRRRAANLARFQSPRIVEALAAQSTPFERAKPQTAIVFFVDVVDFTARAERIGPARTAAFLRSFHLEVEASADPLGGTIMDFAGDGVLVVFGLPEATDDDAQRALAFIGTLFAKTAREGIALRAGGHAGAVKLDVLGGARHRTVSVSGDTVNTASRLQEIAKAYHVSLAVSQTLVEREPASRAWVDQAGLARLSDQRLRGRVATETIWIGDPRIGILNTFDMGGTHERK